MQPKTYQQRAASIAVLHMAYILGCIALGDTKGAVKHSAAASAWTAVAVSAAAVVRAGTPQWLLDSAWVEPAYVYDMLVDDDEDAN